MCRKCHAKIKWQSERRNHHAPLWWAGEGNHTERLDEIVTLKTNQFSLTPTYPREGVPEETSVPAQELIM